MGGQALRPSVVNENSENLSTVKPDLPARRFRFSLRGMFGLIILFAVTLAVLRLLATHTEMVPPFLLLWLCTAFLLTARFAERFKSASARLFMGFLVLPFVYVTCALLIGLLIYGMRALMLA